jgi:hypothetical protein
MVQRMHTRQRAQYLGSVVICWCSTCSAVVASSPRNRANSLQSNGAITSLPVVAWIPQAAWIASGLLPAHEPYRHNGPSRAATVLPWPSGFSPSYMKFGAGSWRDVIVARRTRKSSASFDAPAMVSLREPVGLMGFAACCRISFELIAPGRRRVRTAASPPFIPGGSGPSPRASWRQRARWLPAPPKIAVQIYSQGLMTQMTACRTSRWRRRSPGLRTRLKATCAREVATLLPFLPGDVNRITTFRSGATENAACEGSSR